MPADRGTIARKTVRFSVGPVETDAQINIPPREAQLFVAVDEHRRRASWTAWPDMSPASRWWALCHTRG
jgi:hypothetical protein